MRRLALALFLFLAGSLAHGETLWTESSAKTKPAKVAPVFGAQLFTKLSAAVGPAVVQILSIQANDRTARRSRGQGAGVIIRQDGYVLTNSHVVENAEDIRVRLADERELTGKLVGRDERTDMALLKVEAGKPLPVAPFGDSDALEIGEWVMAIGNPFGLDRSVTVGIVSAKGRRDVRPGGQSFGFYDFIQTDASINPGNSGGPLINTRGEVIGINTAMNAQAQGIGFAIPINMAKIVAPLLLEHGRAPRSWLGINPQSLNPSLRRAFKLGEQRGAVVADVTASSPAAKAGFLIGDVVTAVDSKPLRSADELSWQIAIAPAGKTMQFTVLRDGKRIVLTARAEPSPDDSPPEVKPAPAAPPKRSALGMTVSDISPTIARELGDEKMRGAVVMSVEPESPAVEAGVERGDVLLRVGGQEVKNLDDYAKAIRAVPSGQMITLLLKRDNRNFWVAFPRR
jgi:serine protease Do